MTNASVGEIARDAQFKLTINALANKPRLEDALTIVDNALSLTSGLLNVVVQKASPLACCAGCHACCYLMATVSAPEALSIVQRLKASLSTKQLNILKQKIERAYRQTKKMDSVLRTKSAVT